MTRLSLGALCVLGALAMTGCPEDETPAPTDTATPDAVADTPGTGDTTPDPGTADPSPDPTPDLTPDPGADLLSDPGPDSVADAVPDATPDADAAAETETDTGVQPTQESWQNPPEIVAAVDGSSVITLDVDATEVEIAGQTFCARTYNESIPGPTIRIPASANPRSIRIDLNNNLMNSDMQAVGPPMGPGGGVMYDFNHTNLHTHGFHVQPEFATGSTTLMGDNVLFHLLPAQSQSYQFDIDEDVTHEAGTFWYHPHVHGATAIQVGGGMAGAIIIEGPVDEIPSIAEANERIMVMQHIPYSTTTPSAGGCTDLSISFNDFGAIAGPPDISVNGQVEPTMVVAPGAVERWRFIHGGVTAEMTMRFAPASGNDCSQIGTPIDMHQIAADGFTFQQKWTRSAVFMAPGYRADVMVEAPTTEGLYCLIADVPGAPGQVNTHIVANVVVEAAAGPATGGVPTDAELLAVAEPPLDCTGPVDGTQSLIFAQQQDENGQECEGGPPGGLKFNINCKAFDENAPRVLTVDTTEEWTLTSENGNHPYHIHVNPFTMCGGQVDGEAIPFPHWRDTVLVFENQDITVRTHYGFYSGSFVTHCHKLHHEDQGMMEVIRIDP